MNWDQIEGNWTQFKGKVREEWGELTDDEVDQAEGNREQLIGKIQEKYGKAREEAEREVAEWQNRPLEPLYPLVFFDALRVKVRDEGTVRNKAVYVALGVRIDGQKEVLGLWIEQTEGAKFWLNVLTE